MAIDLPHPWPLPLGWQSARPVGFWVNKHFLLWRQSGVEIESSERLGNTFLLVSSVLLTGQLKSICHSWTA